jgi:carbon storage regulator
VSGSARGSQICFERKELVMLVLSRKVGESIVVPEHEITLTVISVQGSRVRLAISAPLQTEVHREEIWRRICAERGISPRHEWQLQTT